MEKKPEAVATAMEFEEKEAMWARILAKIEELSSALDRVLGSPSAPSTRINAAASSPLAATTEGTSIESDATPMPPVPTRCSALCLNHVIIEPMVPFTLMASATAATTMPLDMATVVPTASLQEEVGQVGALQVFDRTPERIRSGAKHPRFVKWVSRVPISRRPVRWPPRRKYRHSSPPPPPCPPEQQCVGQETAPKPLPWPSFQFVTLLLCNYKLTAPEKKAWCQNAFSPGEKQLHRVHLFKLFCPAVVLQHGSYMMLVSLGKQWKSSPGIWYWDGILFGAKEWVLRICSRNSLLDTCGITCMLRSRFRLSSDQGQGELFACSAGKSVEVPCSIFSLNIMMESVQCSAINVLELFFRNSWWVLEVIFWMNNLDAVEFSYCTHGFALAQGFVLRRMWSGALLLNYQVAAECMGIQTVSASHYKIRMAQQKLAGIDFHSWNKGYHFLLGWMDIKIGSASCLHLIKHRGEGVVLLLNREQNINVLVIPELGRTTHVIAIMHVVPGVEVLVAHHAHKFGLHAVVAIRLRSTHIVDVDCILEFSLPVSYTCSGEQQMLVNDLSSTIQRICKGLRIVSGAEVHGVDACTTVMYKATSGSIFPTGHSESSSHGDQPELVPTQRIWQDDQTLADWYLIVHVLAKVPWLALLMLHEAHEPPDCASYKVFSLRYGKGSASEQGTFLYVMVQTKHTIWGFDASDGSLVARGKHIQEQCDHGDSVKRMLLRIHEMADLSDDTGVVTLFHHHSADALFPKVFRIFSKLFSNKHQPLPWDTSDMTTRLFAHSDTDTWDPGGVCRSGLRASRNLRGRECHVHHPLGVDWAFSSWALGQLCLGWALEYKEEGRDTGKGIEENESKAVAFFLPKFVSFPTSCSADPIPKL